MEHFWENFIILNMLYCQKMIFIYFHLILAIELYSAGT